MLPRLSPAQTRALLISAAGWFLLAVLRTAVRVLAVPRPLEAAALALGRTLLASLPWMFAAPAIVALAARLPWDRGTRGRTVGTWLGVALLWSVVESLWAYAAVRGTGQAVEGDVALWYLARLDQSAFLFLGLVGIGVALRHRRRLDAALLASARLESRLQQARLHVLSLQLHPHFLFNTLNAVSELVHRDAAAARRVLAGLGDLLRRSLAEGTPQEITVHEELALLDPYLDIQRVRFGDALAIEIEADHRASYGLVPRLVLQPLVENAIRHGTARRGGKGRITVRALVESGRLVLEVEDDGAGVGGGREAREGLGLGNTRARLRELYGDHAALTLRGAPVRGAVVRLECPYRTPDRDPGGATASSDVEITPEISDVGSRRRLAAGLGLGWLLAALAGTHADHFAARLMGEPVPLGDILLERLGQAAIWLALSPVVLWCAGHLARAAPGWPALAGAHLVLAAAVSGAHAGLTLALVTPGLAPPLVAVLVVADLSVYAALAAAGHAWAVRERVAEGRATAARLEGELAAARLDGLRWRLRPELLSRALDAIARLAGRDPTAADEVTVRLGELLRLLLPTQEGELVPLESELALLTAYLDVSRAAGLAAPTLELSIGGDAELVPVPAMLLLPLAEVVAGGASGPLVVTARVRDGRLALTVRGERHDRGQAVLGELRRRLVRLYGRDCNLAVEPVGDAAVATLTLPGAPGWKAVA